MSRFYKLAGCLNIFNLKSNICGTGRIRLVLCRGCWIYYFRSVKVYVDLEWFLRCFHHGVCCLLKSRIKKGSTEHILVLVSSSCGSSYNYVVTFMLYIEYLTLGDDDEVSLTGDIVHSTVGIGGSVGRWSRGSKTDFEGIRCVLNTAVSRLLSDTDGVVLVGEMDSSSKVVTLQSPSHSCEPLAAS